MSNEKALRSRIVWYTALLASVYYCPKYMTFSLSPTRLTLLPSDNDTLPVLYTLARTLE